MSPFDGLKPSLSDRKVNCHFFVSLVFAVTVVASHTVCAYKPPSVYISIVQVLEAPQSHCPWCVVNCAVTLDIEQKRTPGTIKLFMFAHFVCS